MFKLPYDEHLHLCREFVKLKLWFLWYWIKDHPYDASSNQTKVRGSGPHRFTLTFDPGRTETRDEGFISALRNRVNIYCHTDIHEGSFFGEGSNIDYQDPRWQVFEKSLLASYRDTQTNVDASIFEKEGFDILRNSVNAHEERTYGQIKSEKRPFGSFKYNRDPKNLNVGFIHITNPLRPNSIFDDKSDYLFGCFFDLIHEFKNVGVDTITTNTWLNSYPPWLAFFPDEWMKNMKPTEPPDRRGGWWGQFINRRGAFNEKHAQTFRSTGQFPFKRQLSWCSIDALETHLKKIQRHNL